MNNNNNSQNIQQTDAFLQQLSKYKHEDNFLQQQKEQNTNKIQQQQQELKIRLNKKQQELLLIKQQEQQICSEISSLEKQIVQTKVNAFIIQKETTKEQESLLEQVIEMKNQKEKSSVERNTYTKQEKKNVVLLFDCFTLQQLSSLSGVNTNLIWKWKNQGINPQNSKRGRKLISLELEQFMQNYVTQQRQKLLKISTKMFAKTAKKFVKDNDIELLVSDGFIRKFLKRNNLSIRRITSSKVVVPDKQVVIKFISKMSELIESNEYDFEHIINFDEIGIFKDDCGTQSIAFRGDKSVQVKTSGNDKTMYSIGLAISYEGSKLKQSVVWPSKGKKKIFKNEIPESIQIIYRDKGSWFDQNVFKQWIKHNLSEYAKQLPSHKKGLLLIDNHKSHNYADLMDDLKKINYDLEKLPSNTTDQLQPLDLSLNKIFRQKYRDLWEEKQIEVEDETKVKKITHDEFLQMIDSVWGSIEQESIQNCWNVYRNSQNNTNTNREESNPQLLIQQIQNNDSNPQQNILDESYDTSITSEEQEIEGMEEIESDEIQNQNSDSDSNIEGVENKYLSNNYFIV
ncbi:hypothetical protein ABPG72_015357 [Tetrahymena utriculariae]